MLLYKQWNSTIPPCSYQGTYLSLGKAWLRWNFAFWSRHCSRSCTTHQDLLNMKAVPFISFSLCKAITGINLVRFLQISRWWNQSTPENKAMPHLSMEIYPSYKWKVLLWADWDFGGITADHIFCTGCFYPSLDLQSQIFVRKADLLKKEKQKATVNS